MFEVVLVFIFAVKIIEAAEISCEKIDSFERFETCCYFNEATMINISDASFAGHENSDVSALLIANNRKVEFLPTDIYKKFPNLEVYFAKGTSVKKISSQNFARLTNLRLLDLSMNELEVIPDDCFQGLTRLYKIDLSKDPLIQD